MSDLAITAGIRDVQRDVRIIGQVLSPIGTPSGQVLTADGAGGSSWQAAGGAGALTQIFDSTLAAPAANFDITGIAATFSHLKLVLYARSTQAANTTSLSVRFNGDSAANYDSDAVSAIDNGAANGNLVANTTGIQGLNMAGGNAAASRFSAIETVIPNYSGTTGFKTMTGTSVTPIGAGGFTLQMFFGGGHWRNTAAINQVTLLPASGNFATGTRATLYGMT